MISAPALAADNLVPNPGFLAPGTDALSPFSWRHGSSDIEGVSKSEFRVGPAGSPAIMALGIKGGEDRAGQWWCTVEGLEKGRSYRLSFRVYREEFVDGMFPEVELFGSKVRMSNLLSFGGWQEFGLVFVAAGRSTVLRFMNDHPFMTYFASPAMVNVEEKVKGEGRKGESKVHETGLLMPDLFPLVAYGAGVQDFPFLADVGFNSAVLALNGRDIAGGAEAALREGLRLVASVRDERSIKEVAASAGPALLGWYVEDEPEGRSVPAIEIAERVKKIREAGSALPAFMAMVRPEFVKAYRDAADIILMDQYPVPGNPLIWLSRSMDEAVHAGAKEVWAVVQIFGGQSWKGKGWDRESTYDEMKALSYLAVVHGARGLFFYTMKDGNYDVRLDPGHLGDVKRVVRELGFLSPYLLGRPAGSPGFHSDSLYAFAPDGTKPVHARTFSVGRQRVIIAVNVLDKEVKGRLAGMEEGVPFFDEYFSGRRYVVRDGDIADVFGPYEVKIYISGKEFRKVRVLDGGSGAVKADFYAEVAATARDAARGLMFRDLPSEERALLFVNEPALDMQIYGLNMKIPFDVIFIDRELKVSAVHGDAAPCTDPKSCVRYGAPVLSRMVLEIRAGVAQKHRIRAGDRIEVH